MCIHHFPRQRLCPYGEIKDGTAYSIMLEKSTSIYCEYVVRLVVTLSEMADTISSNVTILKDSIRNIDKSKIVREVEKMYEAVKMFNTRSELTVTNSNVHQLLKYEIRDGEEQTDDTFGKTSQVVIDLVAELHNTNHYLYVDNFYTSPVLFLLLKERGILAAGTARPRKGYPYDQLKGTVLQKCGDVAWLTEKDRKMTALRWKEKKDVFFLSTIHPPPVVPAWVENGLNPKGLT